METLVEKNRLKFETFKKKRNKSFAALPKWFNEIHFQTILSHMNNERKLEAVKYIYTYAKTMKTDLSLKQAKEEYIDEIQLLGGKVALTPKNAPVPAHTALSNLIRDLDRDRAIPATGSIGKGEVKVIPNQEVLRVIEPFARLANQVLHNSNLNPNQIVYAYNGAQITMQDMRNVETLLKRLAR